MRPLLCRPTMRPLLCAATTALVCNACASSEASPDRWNGTIDTLPSGQIMVRNTADPVWTDETQWTVAEELRIGTVDVDGPELFGRIVDLAADARGRIYVLESQAHELRIFDEHGAHIRTVGRQGGGPGEFAQPVMMDWGRDGSLLIVDPSNNRISRFDTSGVFLSSIRQPGGFVIIPWPGRFDRAGNYYGPLPLRGGSFRTGLVRHDTAFIARDTLVPPEDPVEREYFENDRGNIRAGIPYAAGFRWRLSTDGTFLGLFTGEYRFIEISQSGDTLRQITREFDPLPVTAADRDSAARRLEWFTNQGGKIDLSKLPRQMPAAQNFFWDDQENLWVIPITERDREQRLAHVFDSDGRFLGEVTFPFRLRQVPYPVFQNGMMYAVVADELDVQFVVRARVVKPGTER